MPLSATAAASVVAMIGSPVAQTVLPSRFNAWFSDKSINALMVPLDVAPESLAAFCEAVRGWSNCRGFVVTAPHKQAILPMLDTISDTARLIGAVNIVVRNADGRLQGDTIDGAGFFAALRKKSFDPSGKSALLFGCGGAGAAIAAELIAGRIARLDLIDLDGAKAVNLSNRLGLPCKPCEPDAAVSGYDLIVNATAIGLGSNAMVHQLDGVAPGTLVADVVTHPPVTAFLAGARTAGCTIQTGAEMAEGQFEMAASQFGFM